MPPVGGFDILLERRLGNTMVRWLDGIADSMDMNFSKLWKILEDRGDWGATILEIAESLRRGLSI